MGMERTRVLFLCGRNTARSQMAEAFLNHLGGDRFEGESAGLEAGEALHPLAVRVMAEVGIDMAAQRPKRAFDLFQEGRLYDTVVAVCDAAVADRCPVYPEVTRRLSWPFPDPAATEGTEEERLEQVRRIRDQIRSAVEKLVASESGADPEN